MKQHIGNVGLLNLMDATEDSVRGIERIDNVGMVVFKKSTAHLLHSLNIGNIGQALEIPDGYRYLQGDLVINAAYLNSVTDPLSLVVSGNVMIENDVYAEAIGTCPLQLIVKGKVYSPVHLAGKLYAAWFKDGVKIIPYEGCAPRFERGVLKLTNGYLSLFEEPQWLIVNGELLLPKDLDLALFANKISKLEVKGELTLYEDQEPYVFKKMDAISAIEVNVIPEGFEPVEKQLILNGRSIRRFNQKKLWLTQPLVIQADVSREALEEAIDGIYSSSLIICPETLEDLLYERTKTLDTEVLSYTHDYVLIEGEEKWSKDQFLAYDHPINLMVTGRLTLDQDVSEDIIFNQVVSMDLFGDLSVPNSKLKGALRTVLRVNEGRMELLDEENRAEFRNIGQLTL
jgi:hypothetical protein